MPTKTPTPTYKKNNVTGGRGSMPGGRNNTELIIKDAERVARAYLAAHPVTPKTPEAPKKTSPHTLANYEKWAVAYKADISKSAVVKGFELLAKLGFLPKKKR